MSTQRTEEKPVESYQLAVNTSELASRDGAALSPATTLASNTGALKETSVDYPRNSNLSSPCSAHRQDPFDTDVEAALGQSCENLNRKSTQFTGKTLNNPNCTVWPGQDHWKQKARANKIKNRSCKPMARLSKRTRFIVKILIALLIVGIGVGVGLGVSKSLGVGVWKPSGQ